MFTRDLHYNFPQDLIATEPLRPPRVLLNGLQAIPQEIAFSKLFELFEAGDVLVLNETKVIPSRVRDENGLDFLFTKDLGANRWEVLFPAKAFSPGQLFQLPGGVEARLEAKGLPQVLATSKFLNFEYFNEYGEVNLPPYILEQRSRELRPPNGPQNVRDRDWYQTEWARDVGSVAAPTASLHFSQSDLQTFVKRGVQVKRLTLHVGLGTFLPVRAENLKDHKMHFETFHIPKETQTAVDQAKAEGKRVWALGTTVARALESMSQSSVPQISPKIGETNIFIYPPYEFRVVNGLLTNFHQPESTLLALVCAFYGTKQVMAAYRYAITERFRLFSYGDLSIWMR